MTESFMNRRGYDPPYNGCGSDNIAEQEYGSLIARSDNGTSAIHVGPEPAVPAIRSATKAVREYGDEGGPPSSSSGIRYDFDAKCFAEISKKVMSAIDEHKDRITVEYKNLKRDLDIERGNTRSQVKLANKERRSRKHIEQLEKEEHATKKMHLNKLHGVLMKHHFSLAQVEDGCIQALRDEWINCIQATNKIELALWKRTCQDVHEALDAPVKGFMVKKRWKSINSGLCELTDIMNEGAAQLRKLYIGRGIKPKSDSIGWKFINYLQELNQKAEQHARMSKKVLVKVWLLFGEELKDTLCKYTQLVKYEHEHRHDALNVHCYQLLTDMQERAARRHGKLMQKVAKEQELLDKERTDWRSKHSEQKPRTRSTRHHNNNNIEERPPLCLPHSARPGCAGVGAYGTGGVDGVGAYGAGGASGMGAYGAGGASGMGAYGAGGASGMGAYGNAMLNYNMSNAADVVTCSTVITEMSPQQEVTCMSPDAECCAAAPLKLQLVYRESALYPGSPGTPPAPPCQPGSAVTDGASGGALADTRVSPPPQLTQCLVQSIPAISRSEAIRNYLYSQQTAVKPRPLEKCDDAGFVRKDNSTACRSLSSQISGEIACVIAAVDEGEDNHNLNAAVVPTAASYHGLVNRNINAETSDSGSGDSYDDDESSSANDGSRSSKGGSHKGAGSADSDDSDDDSSSDKERGSGSSKSRGSEDIETNDYKEFVPNQHKAKWTLKNICGRCCSVGGIVDKWCPCLRGWYKEHSSRHEERREKKEMQNNVLLRLRRDEANRAR